VNRTASGYCVMTGCAVVNATTLLMGYNISLVAALKPKLKCVLHAPGKLFHINPCNNGIKLGVP
jgi:hypothetical protein